MTLPAVHRYARNVRGRDFIVGDIHASFSHLAAALDAVGFDPDAGDRLFSVGDLVDRGPEPELALEWLERPWFRAVQGNHEDMAIRWGRPDCRMDVGNYAANGGGWNVANLPQDRVRFADAFAALPVAIEVETSAGVVGLVHASCPTASWPVFIDALENPNLSRSEAKGLRQLAMWDRARIEGGFADPVAGVRAVVCGHTPLTQPTVLGNVWHIDTAGWHPSGAGFTLLNAETLEAVVVPRRGPIVTFAPPLAA